MSFLERAWYKRAKWLVLLLPLAWLFQLLVALRRFVVALWRFVTQQHSERPSWLTVPVVVVGNITLGGTGKTPLLIALANHFRQQGLQPGVISRGYGGNAANHPLLVDADTPVSDCGDEALLISEKTGCPMAVAKDRRAAAQHLLATHTNVSVIISDDGLQHYRLWRDVEIAVIDGERLLGNGYCLPAGPLREPPSRLGSVNFVVINGEPTVEENVVMQHDLIRMKLKPRFFVNLLSGEKQPVSTAPFNTGGEIQAVAGIGNPERFFRLLESLSYKIKRFSFPDHHRFSAEDFKRGGIDSQQTVVMTEKDAVKCRAFAQANFWALAVEAEVPEMFLKAVGESIKHT